MNDWTDPIYFEVKDSLLFNKRFLPVSQNCAAITFGISDLQDPGSDVVGIAFNGGARRYIWQDRWWGEYPLNVSTFMAKCLDLKSVCTKNFGDPFYEECFTYLERAEILISKYRSSKPPIPSTKGLYLPKDAIEAEVLQYFGYTKHLDVTRMIYPIDGPQ
jgi:hypothetical protein